MLATARPGVLPRLFVAAVLLVLAIGAWWGAATPADAATTHRVEVVDDEDGGFRPRTITVEAGDTVQWIWVVDDSRFLEFDDPSRNGGCVRLSSCEGQEHVVAFDEVGRFTYTDRFDGFTGTVVVEPASSPSPSETPSDPVVTPTMEPTPEPSSEPTSGPEPTSEPEPSESTDSPSSTSTPAPAPSSPAPPPEPSPSTDTAAPVAVDSESAPPSPSPEPDAPSVATESSPRPVPVPTFDSFPDASDPVPDTDVDGAVAVDTGDGDRTRTVWGVVGGVTVLGTLGALGRRVLFADPWDGAGDR